MIGMLLLSLSATVNSSIVTSSTETGFDPLVDVSFTVDVQTIRFLEDDDSRTSFEVIISNIINNDFNLYLKTLIGSIIIMLKY